MSDIYLSLSESPTVVTLSQPVVSGVLSSNVTVANVVSVNVVTMPAITVQAAAPAVTTVAGTVTISNFPSTQTIAGTVTANVSFPEVLQTSQRLSANGGESFEEGGYISCQVIPDHYQVGLNRILPECYVADGEVTARFGPNDVQRQLVLLQALGSSGGVYDISSFGNGTMFVIEPFSFDGSPVVKLQYRNSGNTAGEDIVVTNAFKGTSTTNISTADTYVFRKNTTTTHIRLAWVSGTGSATFRLKVHSNPYFGIERPISGTVSVGSSVTIGSLPAISGTVTANNSTIDSAVYLVTGADVNTIRTVIYSGGDLGGDQGAPVDGLNPLPITGSANSTPVPISGTVTANNPSGALTTRFGSVVTANLAAITSAVTNTSRKYLLAQNISAGTVTIGIGFSPTTTQGIQLTAGGGLTFDAFCPTGAVYWLGAVTGAAYTILEG